MWIIPQAFVLGIVLLQAALCMPSREIVQLEDRITLVNAKKTAASSREESRSVNEQRDVTGDDINEPYQSGALVGVAVDPEFNTVDVNNTGVGPYRQKRGWGSVIFVGATLAVRGTSVGLNLAQAITGGCVYYSSICRDKQAIESIEREIRTLAGQYDQEYIQSKVAFLALRTANNNNAYVSYYINSTLRAVEELNDTQQSLLDQMEIELPEIFKIFQASSQNVSAEVYLQSLLGEVEFSLANIRQTLSNEKHNILVGLAIQFGLEAVVGRFALSYQKAYNLLRKLEKEDILSTTYFSLLFSSDPTESGIMLDPNHPLRDELIEAKLAANKAKSDFKMAPKVLKQMLSTTFVENPKQVFNAIKKWKRIKTWEGFKGKFMHSIKGPLGKLRAVKNFFADSKFRKYSVSKFQIGWSVKIMSGIGVLFDIVSQAVAAANWRMVADQISESRKQYEEYRTNLKLELSEIENEKSKIDQVWEDLIDTFRNISVTFRDFVQNATQYSNFSDVIGNPGLPVDLSNPLFNTDFDNLHRDTLEEKQNAVIGFLKEVDNNLTRVSDQLRSRKTLYEVVLSETNNSKPVMDILSSAQTALRYDSSDTVRTYGGSLKEKDIVCSVAILRPTRTDYDFLPLVPFRPACRVNESTFDNLKRLAQEQQEKAKLFESVARYVRILSFESLGLVQDLVISDVGNGNGSNIKEDDILCAIAHEFPDKESYDGRSLLSYRSRAECNQI